MLYSLGNWVFSNNSQFEYENNRFLKVIDGHYWGTKMLPFRTVYAFSIESEWISVTSAFLKIFSWCTP
jgi:hypothetical protein